MNFEVSALDISIIVLSLAVVVAVGLWTGRNKDTSAEGFFLASGRMPWWIIGTAFVSTSVSSEQIVGTVGGAYRYGMGIANWEWWSLPPYAVLIGVFIPIYLRNRISTVPELLKRRYNSFAADIYSYIMLFAYVVVFAVPVLYGGALTFSELTPFNFYLVLWTMVLLVAAYTVKGGLASVMWTDAVQCAMLLGGGLLLFFIALYRIPGGWGAMVEASPERFHLYHPPDDELAPFAGLAAGTFGLFIFYQAANQVMVQRVLSARSMWHGMMGIIFAGFINFVRPLVTCFLGFIVYHWIHEMNRAEPLQSQDLTFPFALKTFAPAWGLRGIILAGFLAAVMSSISALANSTATIFSLDVYKRLINPGASDHRLVRVGQFASLCALVLAGILAPAVEYAGGIFQYFQTGVTYLATPFIAVILVGLFWGRANHQGAIAGLLGGIVVQISVVIVDRSLGWDLHWLYIGAIAEALIVLLVVVVSVATPPPPPEKWKPFLWRPSMLVGITGEVRPWFSSVQLWFSVYAIVFVLVYWWFW